MSNKNQWYERSYRRNLVDMHIEEWDERFLSRLDPETYVKMLKIAKVKSAMIYANSHVGYCYWPTKVGHMHKGLRGRDFLGEVIDLCHKEGIDVIIYYSLIFNNWAYEQHPEWRILDIYGKASRDIPLRTILSGRYGVCCPNSPGYRKFVLDQIEELCQNYDFEGIFFDMTFWPRVCYCPNCKRRYREEVGEDPPTIINWDDPSWIRFQKKREEWLAEFAALVTSTVKKYKPEVTVEHQSSTVPHSWMLGVSSQLFSENCCDFVGGDFYGGVLEQSFICKLYYNLTPKMPFEFMTSICYPNLHEHTTIKSRELIEARAFMTLAHQGAFLIIDAIDPVGTLDERRYKLIGEVYDEISRYEKYLGGELCQDVAIYFSLDSKMDFAENNKRAALEVLFQPGRPLHPPHVEAALGAAEALRTNHIPFGVITKRNLKDLSRYKAIILPNVLRLSDEEADAIKEYILNGGSVYASKFTIRSKLSEIIGAFSVEETSEKFTYIAPTPEGETLLSEITRENPLSIPDSQIKAYMSPKEGVMATITLPFTNPDDATKFASIHSDPPGIFTEYPAIVRRKFGKGEIVWVSASIEKFAIQYLKHRSIFVDIVRSIVKEPFSFESDAPGCVEITQFHKPEENRYLINLVNFQSEIGIPNIPVYNISLRVRIKGEALRVTMLPDEKPIAFKQDGEDVNISIPKLETFLMLALDYN